MSLPLIYIFHPYIRYIYNYYIVHIRLCKRSSASFPRTSPIINLSGRIRRAARISSPIPIAPAPSALASLVSIRTRFSMWFNCSSAASSIVITRSPGGINSESAFKKVVFPAPVPPLTKMLYRAATSVFKRSAASGEILP